MNESRIALKYNTCNCKIPYHQYEPHDFNLFGYIIPPHSLAYHVKLIWRYRSSFCTLTYDVWLFILFFSEAYGVLSPPQFLAHNY